MYVLQYKTLLSSTKCVYSLVLKTGLSYIYICQTPQRNISSNNTSLETQLPIMELIQTNNNLKQNTLHIININVGLKCIPDNPLHLNYLLCEKVSPYPNRRNHISSHWFYSKEMVSENAFCLPLLSSQQQCVPFLSLLQQSVAFIPGGLPVLPTPIISPLHPSLYFTLPALTYRGINERHYSNSTLPTGSHIERWSLTLARPDKENIQAEI